MRVANHLNHLIDVAPVGGGGKRICPFDPQCFDIFEERFFKLRGGFCERNSSPHERADRLVINVSDVSLRDAPCNRAVRGAAGANLRRYTHEKFPICARLLDRRPTGVNVDLASGCVTRLENPRVFARKC